MGEVIEIRDWKRKEELRTLQSQAQELAKEFNRMAEEGTEVVCEMDSGSKAFRKIEAGLKDALEIARYGGQGIDGMPYEAPPTDCA